jgi:RNA polymerase sigma factor (TIGR02999 family)
MPHADVTRILYAIRRQRAGGAELLPLVYDELRRLAGDRLRRESPDQTLEPTALVHEAYLRLVGHDDPGWQNRGHFFAAAAEAMRRILIEAARRKHRIRHGGGRARVDLADQLAAAAPLDDRVDLLALDEALAKLAREDSNKAKLVELRFFTGLSVEEAAAVLKISRATADRWWTYARAFLYCEMKGEDAAE